MDASAGRTFSATHGKAAFIGGPIQAVTADALLASALAGHGSIDVVVGGPPCQGYSYYNHGRGQDDPRAGLFREYLRVVEGLRPRWLVMENVAGITSIGDGAVMREIQQGMSTLGYRVEIRLLRSEDFGVPQERRRMFFIATRTDCPRRRFHHDSAERGKLLVEGRVPNQPRRLAGRWRESSCHNRPCR